MVEITMTGRFRKGLFALYATAWCSGITFFVLKTWFVVDGDFGPFKHPWQFPSLQIHGAAAFLMMITFGFLLGAHVQYTWGIKKRKKSGVAIVTMNVLLMMSAYLLYYIVQNELRNIIEYVHLAIGFALPFALLFHIWKRRSGYITRELSKNLDSETDEY